jgi:hypothetical protein
MGKQTEMEAATMAQLTAAEQDRVRASLAAMEKRGWYEFRDCCAATEPTALCAEHRGFVRAALRATATTDADDPMASYRRGMKKSVVSRTASHDVFRNPPDGYALALNRQR